MFCPKCGSETVNDARFCRTCGLDVALVQRAMTGEIAPAASLAPVDPEEIAKTLSGAIRHGVTGIGFIAVAFCTAIFAPAGQLWWFWMLIPAFSLIGKGISEFVRYRALVGVSARAGLMRPSNPAPTPRELGAPLFGEQIAPPSVTEQTTRHLEQREPER